MRTSVRLNQIVANGECGRLGPVGGVGFNEDVANVVGYGIETDDQVFRDFAVAFTRSDKPQHLDFTFTKAAGITWRCAQ